MRLDRVDSRNKLLPRRDPYWQRLAQGRFIGFRRMDKTSAGTWLARAYDGEKYHQKPIGDFATLGEKQRFDAARKAAEDWFEHLDMGGAVKTTSVRAACQNYVEYLRIENSENAAKDAGGRFRRLIDSDPIGAVELSKLTPTQVAKWKARVLARGGTRGSYNRNATALRAALNLAHSRRAVASDHAWRSELAPFESADGRRELYLNRADRRKLIAKASTEIKPFLTALALLPLRPGDVAALRVADFDAQHGILSIPAGKTRSRKIPLSGEVLTHVGLNAKGKLPTAWLFAKTGGGQWDRFTWRDAINEAVAVAKLPAAVCAYTLRHSAITDLVISGLDLYHVAALSGTSVAMIEKHYGQLQSKQTRAAMGTLALKQNHHAEV